MNRSPFPYGPYQYYDPGYLKKESEKRSLRSLSNRSGVALIILLAAFNLVGLFLQVFMVYSGGIEIKLTGETGQIDSGMYLAMQGIVSIIGMSVAALVLAKTSHLHLDDVIHFRKKVSIKRVLALLPAGLAVFMFSNFMVDYLLQNLEAVGLPYDQSSLGISTDGTVLTNILYVVSVACVPAFVEEFMFRGVLLGALRKYGDGFAILMSSVLFGLMHGNIVQIPFAFTGGLALAFLTVYTGSIIPAMLLHFGNNFYSVANDIILTQYGAVVSNIFFTVSVALILLLGIVGLFFLSRRDKNLFHIEKADSSLTLRQRIKTFLLSPGMVVTILLILIEVVMAWTVL